MKSKTIVWTSSVFLLAALSVGQAIFFVAQNHKAIKFRLGRIVESEFSPGLHLKLPFIEYVKRYDGRIASLDLPAERFLTAEKKNVIVDVVVQWRIQDVVRFYTAVQGDEHQASLRLRQILKDIVRAEFGRRQIQELLSEDRTLLHSVLTRTAAEPAARLGVELIDVQVKRIDLPAEVNSSIFRRMEAERSRVAKKLRSQGAEEAEKIRAAVDKQREILLAQAYRQAQRLRGIGEARAAEIYAEAYRQDPDFFAFLRRTEAYRKGLTQPGDILVLEPGTSFFRDFGQDE
ncbi:protease modulator HflC [Methylothermus subterraneus]